MGHGNNNSLVDTNGEAIQKHVPIYPSSSDEDDEDDEDERKFGKSSWSEESESSDDDEDVVFGLSNIHIQRKAPIQKIVDKPVSLLTIVESIPDKDEKADESDEKITCSLCLENKICISFQPCGHSKTCRSCTVELVKIGKDDSKCPQCRAQITSIHRIFL